MSKSRCVTALGLLKLAFRKVRRDFESFYLDIETKLYFNSINNEFSQNLIEIQRPILTTLFTIMKRTILRSI